MSTLLQALRTATRAAHDRLEAVTASERIMDGSLSPAEYARLIDWQREVHQLLEPRVSNFTAPNYRYRRRFPNERPASDPAALPEAIGILYVLEGASLGGSLIYKKLLANTALAEYNPFPFYRDQAEWGLQQWRAFVTYLKQLRLGPAELRRVTASAVATFHLFERKWQ